jgi:hypothetical protein
VIGALTFIGPGFAVILFVISMIVIARNSSKRAWATAGFFLAAGVASFVVLWRAASACQLISTPTYTSDCRPPDLGPYIGLSVAALIVGVFFVLIAGGRLAERFPGRGRSKR